MKRGFSLVELMIVVAVLGILAAIVVPQFQSHTSEAKESAAKNNLHILRVAIKLYAAQHNDVPPGYLNGDTSASASAVVFILQLTKSTNESGELADAGTAGYPLGPYISAMPKNPFNSEIMPAIVGNSESFPTEATGVGGWIYKAATKEIRLNWPGTDSKDLRYYDY
jgi:prepilin-type N-terminal cleavage/methylation domain-containing protein